MDEENRTRHYRDMSHAEDVVPRLGWSRPLVDVLRLAHDGRLLVSQDGTYRQPGSGTKPGRRVNKQRVDLLLNAGFLTLTNSNADGSTLLPTAHGKQGLYLADLHPEGLHADDAAAYAARLKSARRGRIRNSDGAKAMARRLPAMEKWDLRWSEDRPLRLSPKEHALAAFAMVLTAFDSLQYVAHQRGARAERDRLSGIQQTLTDTVAALEQNAFAQASHGVFAARAQAIAYQEAIAHDPSSAETAAWVDRLQEAADLYLTHWPAHTAEDTQQSTQTRLAVPHLPTADGPQSANAPSREATQSPSPVAPAPLAESAPTAPADAEGRATSTASGRSAPTDTDAPVKAARDNQPAAPDGAPGDPAVLEGAAPQDRPPASSHPTGEAEPPILREDWTLTLPEGPEPLNAEAWASAWALRGVLSDRALIELMAAVDDDDAFARWKTQHVRYYGEGTGHVNKDLAPGAGVRHKYSAKQFEAQIADQTVKATWDRIRLWLREATTPEALSLLQAAEEAGARLRGGSRGDSLLAATGELDLARELRIQIKQLTTQVLDHVIQFLANTPVPTGRRSKPSDGAAAGTSLFDLDAAPAFDLAGADQVRADLHRLIAYLPDPRADKTPKTVPLSELTAGMVLDRDHTPVVITEIIRHPGRCDIVGDFRGPIWPARIKHSVELPHPDSDPPIALAPLLPSLHALTGRQPEPDHEEAPGPLVEGHPARAASAGPRPRAEAAAPRLAPPAPRMPDLVWDEQRRRAHGQALADLISERPPLSAQRRELDPDDPYAQFTDNVEHQLPQLADHPDEHAAVAQAAQDIHDTVTDLASRARAYSTERLRTAEGAPAELLQLTLEPSRTAPFVRIAMNAIMRAIDTAEDAVTSADAKKRVRAALTAVVCTSPPRDPQGDSAQDFRDALVEFESVAAAEENTVAELLAGPAEWAHFAELAARVEAATATPDPNPPAPRFAHLDELRAHLAELAVRPPNSQKDSAGLIRYGMGGRTKYAARLATDPTLELTPGGRLAIHGSASDGWYVITPGSAGTIVPWSVKSRRHALRYAALLERLTDTEGNAYPWDADDFPSPRTPYEPQGGHLLYDYVQSNHSHLTLGFQHRLTRLRKSTQAYGWMEDLSLRRFSDFDYIHPADPADLVPGDEVMFTFDQNELEYASSVAGYFPPVQGGTLAIGTAVVGPTGELIPGFWWPDRHPDQAQRLTKDVALRDGVRRARPGEYSLHAGITAHLPELAAQQPVQFGPSTAPSPGAPRAEVVRVPDPPTPPTNATPAPRAEISAADGPAADASSPEEVPTAAAQDGEAPSSPSSHSEFDRQQAEANPVPLSQPPHGDAATETSPPATQPVPDTDPDPETQRRQRLANNAAFGEFLGIDTSAGESFEGYAGRFDGDYDITLPSGRYCYRTPGFDRKNYSVRFIPDPTRAWESKQIKAVTSLSEIMPVVRRHAARNADRRDPRTVDLNEHEQQALEAVARGIIFRSRGDWYRVVPNGRGTDGTLDWTTHALWSLSALGLITVPAAQPEAGQRQHARLTEIGEQRRNALHGETLTDTTGPDIQEQTALFAEPVSAPAPEPDEQASATGESAPSGGEAEAALPRYSRERHQALDYIARGVISMVDGTFMLTNPRRPTRQAPSQKHLLTAVDTGLAQIASGTVHLSNSGISWFAHHGLTLPAVARDVETVAQAPLPPIDYTPLGVLPVPEEQQDGPRPPAPSPLPDNWHRVVSADEEGTQAALAVAADAAERAAQTTARDVADLAAGPDHGLWTHEHPLAQYDENAAAALETVTDPRSRDYATRAVHHLRSALVEAGHQATDHYVQNVRSPEWRTTMGKQTDDVHRDRVRGIVVSYLIELRTHATEHDLDADTIIHVLEDAAGWSGDLRPLGRKQVAVPHLPAAESVAEAAQHVANALRNYALGETDTVDTHTERRATWRPVGPRPSPAAPDDRQGPVPGRATPAQDSTDPRGLEQPTAPGVSLSQPPSAPAPAAAAQEQATNDSAPAQGDGRNTDAPATSARAGQDGGPGTSDAPQVEAVNDTPAGQQERATPATAEDSPPRPPAAVREEGTVATSTPPSTAAAEDPVAAGSTGPKDQAAALDPATAYPDAAAYAAGHEALLAELGQQEQWLVRSPAAAAAATALVDGNTLGPSGLTALLVLQAALTPTTDHANRRTHLEQRLDHHILCAQLTMAKAFFAQATRSEHREQLRELHQMACDGRFIAVRQLTEDGEMELGQYLNHRAQQLTQQPADGEGRAEETSAMAEETTVAVDPDDEIPLPAFERPGEVIMDAAEAAPRLLDQARTHLAGGNAGIELLAHIHGRPIYAMVNQPGTRDAALMLGLTAANEEGDARAVTIREEDLARVAPETLLTAVTAWANASDSGGRPVLDYAPTAESQESLPGTSASGRRPPAEEAQPPQAGAAAPAPAMPGPTRDRAMRQAPPAAQNNQTAEGLSGQPGAAPEAAAEVVPEASATAQEALTTSSPSASTTQETQQDGLISPGGSPVEPPAAASAGEQKSLNGDRQVVPAAAAAADRSAPTDDERVGQLETLARAALTDLGVSAEVTGVLVASRTVALTLESSGNADRDRETSANLRTALTRTIRQHPDQGLAAYRVDIEHTSQVGQGSLTADPSVPQESTVPRERLIAANNAAAAILAERLQNDPNAALARTYLAKERQLPTEVQEEWGLGYAPSDRGAGRWDLLTRELTGQGFTEDELLQSGLAIRSSRGTLIDYFDDRIMFPIHDEQGEIVGFSGRRIDRPGETEEQAKRQGQKYFNTSNDAVLFSKGELLFGLHHPVQARALADSGGPRVSVEGYLDVIAVARAAAMLPLEQRPVVGAPMGTAITERQLTVLRGLDTDNPRPHIAFLDADDSGRKVLLDKWDLLVKAAGTTEVTTAPGAKDAAKLWEDGVTADGYGPGPVLRALQQRQPLLDATVEAVLLKNADETERANHTFDASTFYQRTQAMAAVAASYIHQTVRGDEAEAPADRLEEAALTWAKRLHQEWSIPGHMTATAVLLGPGNHTVDRQNEVYEQALDLLAADPEEYFADDSHVRSRQSAAEAPPVTAPAAPDGTAPENSRPGQWPAGTGTRGPATPASAPASPAAVGGELALSMVLPSPVDEEPVEHTDRTTAAYALHAAVYERLGRHAAEQVEPNRLPRPLTLGTVHGVDLSTSGDDQTSEDPTVVVWLGPSRSDSLRLSYSRFVEMTGPELLAAVEWRAARAAGLLGTSLSQAWRDAVRSILPSQFPAQPTPAQFSDLLDTIAQGPDGNEERIRHRAEQAVDLYTTGHPDLALNHLAANDHIWVLRNDGSWIQEEAIGAELSWEALDNGFSDEASELDSIVRAASELPVDDPAPMPADLTVAHHSAHEALAVLRPYSIGLPNTLYERITDLVAQMDAGEPALRRLHGPNGEQLMNRVKSCFVRVLEGLATVASKIRLTGLSMRLERTVARLRGQGPDSLSAPRAVRTDRRMQDLAHIERDLERRMAAATTTLGERGELQEQWIVNRARSRARYEQLTGQPPTEDFLPDNGLIAGAPPVPNAIDAHDLLIDRLDRRVVELRDTDPHTGEQSNPYDPTADLLNGVAWAYHQRLIGALPSGPDPQGPIPPTQLRQAALTVTSHRNAFPLTLRRTMHVTAERADRLLHHLEERQILGPYRPDALRTVLARPTDIDALLARPARPRRTAPAAPTPAQTVTTDPAHGAPDSEGADAGELDTARIQEMVSKILAAQEKRSEPQAGAKPVDSAPAARARQTAHREAESNALAAGQSTSLAPSQS
ncbi:toprim domain-containing protein [Streptomyces sp. NPDC014846]|uniref:toprim domain-containing protein n=1 Tax=Streptomyces sp. NPDC014846 TaxID=3364922 RepID=UPI0036FAB5FF